MTVVPVEFKAKEVIAVLGLLAVAVVTANSPYQYVLVLYLLFIPFISPDFVKTPFANSFTGELAGLSALKLSLLCATLIVAILIFHPDLWRFGLSTLLLVALPEELFFRAYLQRRLGNHLAAIITVSLIFSITHGLATSWLLAALVFVPSLVFGWVYKKSGSLALVILFHALANFMPKLAVYYFPSFF